MNAHPAPVAGAVTTPVAVVPTTAKLPVIPTTAKAPVVTSSSTTLATIHTTTSAVIHKPVTTTGSSSTIQTGAEKHTETVAGPPSVDPTQVTGRFVQPTIFPPSFPGGKNYHKQEFIRPPPRQYAIFKNPTADNMAIFLISLAAAAVFMFCLIKIARWSERNKGKVDHMITDETRWGEVKQNPYPQQSPSRVVHHHHPGMRSNTPVDGRYVNPSQQANRNDYRVSKSSMATDVSSMPTPGFHSVPSGSRLYAAPNGSSTTAGFYSDAASAGSMKSFATVSTVTPQHPQQLHSAYHQGGYSNMHPPQHKQRSPPQPGAKLLVPPPRSGSNQQQWAAPQYPNLPPQPRPHATALVQPPHVPQWRKPTPWTPNDGPFPGPLPPAAGRPMRPVQPGQSVDWRHAGDAYPPQNARGPSQWPNV